MIRGDLAVWLALLAAAWTSGLLLARVHRDPNPSQLASTSTFVTAALIAWAWATLAGAFLRGDPGTPAVAQALVIDAPAALRFAALAHGLHAASLTMATVLAFAGLMITSRDASHARHEGRTIRLAVISVATTLLLVASVLAPSLVPAGTEAPQRVPLWLVHAGAAANSVATLAALVLLVVIAAWIAGAKSGPVPVSIADGRVARLSLSAWLLASLALGADQWARTAVTLPELPGVTAPRNVEGLLLWLALGTLAHARVRRLIFGVDHRRDAGESRWPVRLTHAGALLIALAFAAHIVAARTSLTIPQGRSMPALDVFHRPWQFSSQGVSRFDAGETDIIALTLDARAPSGRHGLLTTQLKAYRDRTGEDVATPLSFRAVAHGPLQDVLVTLDAAEANDVAHVRVAFVPLASLWLPGLALLLLGGAWMLARPMRESERPA